MASISWVFLTVVACAFFIQGEAITCYTCGLATGRECGDEPDTSALTEVTDCQYCVKTKSIDSYGFHTVYRTCVTSDTVDASGVSEVKMGCTTCRDCGEVNYSCMCDGEKCNHGTTVLVSLTTIMAMLTFVKLFK